MLEFVTSTEKDIFVSCACTYYQLSSNYRYMYKNKIIKDYNLLIFIEYKITGNKSPEKTLFERIKKLTLGEIAFCFLLYHQTCVEKKTKINYKNKKIWII